MSASVILVANHGELGGGEVMLVRCAQTLRELGLTPVVVAPDAPSTVADAAREQGVSTTTYRPGGQGPAGGLRALRETVVRARTRCPGALTWCHGLGAAVATAGMSRRVVHLHRVPDARQLPALLVACAGAMDVLVPSADTLSRLPRPLRSRAHQLPNWTEDIPFRSSRVREETERVYVGFLGRPAPGKGVSDLVVALAGLRDVDPELDPVLLVAGRPLFVSAPRQREVQRDLASLGERARQLGWMDRDLFLDRVDVLACPSRWPESFGLVAAEAMAAGVPVVVSDAGALPEVVGHRYPYTARSGDPADLRRVLAAACRDLGTQRGQSAVVAARQRWETLWSPAAGRVRLAHALKRWEVHP